MRNALLALALLLPAAEARPAAVRGTVGCDMKVTEKREYCPKCDKVFPKEAKKIRRCPSDKESLIDVDICVRQRYVAKCHPDKTSSKPVSCCGVTYDKPERDEKDIFWVCEGCGTKSRTLGKVTHTPDCANKRPRKKCDHPA